MNGKQDEDLSLQGTFVELPHTADRALAVEAESLPALFAAAARGMFHLMADLEAIPPRQARPVYVEGPDLEVLLVEWLNELLYLHEAHQELYSRFDVARLEDGVLEATARGAPGVPTKAKIKAATYHDLSVRQDEGRWRATIVFDV
ncbi:MAG: archease [Anaerolineae bacterium]|nr:archease [Anaerolineae bacterium]